MNAQSNADSSGARQCHNAADQQPPNTRRLGYRQCRGDGLKTGRWLVHLRLWKKIWKIREHFALAKDRDVRAGGQLDHELSIVRRVVVIEAQPLADLARGNRTIGSAFAS